MNIQLFFALTRSLLPRWSFYDKVGTKIVLEVRSGADQEWRPVDLAANFQIDQSQTQSHRLSNRHSHFSIWSLFINPHLNLQLAKQTAIEHFAQDVIEQMSAELPDAETSELPSKSVENLTSFKIVSTIANQQGSEFRLVVVDRDLHQEILFHSELIKHKQANNEP